MRPQHLRTDPLPLSWEVPTTIALCWVISSLAALPFGQGVSALTVHGSFLWPNHDLVASIGGLLTGDPGAGIRRGLARGLPSRVLVYTAVVFVEAVNATLWSAAAYLWWRHGGPGTQWGMATRAEARQVLGTGNLRSRRALLRPDLFGRDHR